MQSSLNATPFLSWETVIPAVPLHSNSAATITASLDAHEVTAAGDHFSMHLRSPREFWF